MFGYTAKLYLSLIPVKKTSSFSPPMLLPAYFVQEKHHFVETVQLKGLQYDTGLQDENSGFSIVLTSVLKSQVS